MVVNELKLSVATKIAKYAVPDQILVSQVHLRGNSITLFKSLLSTNVKQCSTFTSKGFLLSQHQNSH